MDDDTFWKSASENAPETRLEIAKRARKREEDEKPAKEKKALRMFAKDGRPLNINQAKVKFQFSDEDPSQFVLDIAVYKWVKFVVLARDRSAFFADIWIRI